ncbi:ABC transporter ATP-binding protein [Kitasatospora mediocidica]|uniref:ABC transporter ATP-binding protein n=1 Tax=Kitasatospora mediocidica TaxID=58352 RepID=UPI00055C05BB|nr:ABC transporter ATP-binding protein [Kitasatospora mediocidica]
MTAVEAVALRRTYDLGRGRGGGQREVVALHALDFRVDEGTVHGLLGPNGAGKTTLCKILATVLLPTSGGVRVFGNDVVSRTRQVRQSVGVVFGGERGLYSRLTARQNLHYWCALYGLPRRALLARTEMLLARVGLSERSDEKVDGFSRGMKQRLHLARGLVGDPRLLLLDEPTTGMDPVAARDFRLLVAELRAEGRTILLTTHDMAEAEAVCDRVTLIDGGRALATEHPRALGALVSRNERIEFDSPTADALPGLPALPGVVAVTTLSPGRYRVETTATEATKAVIGLLLDRGATSLTTTRPGLEEVYLKLIGNRGMEVGR